MHLRESLLDHSPIRPEQIHAMPVESPDLDGAARQYASQLGEIAGLPPTLDLVQWVLGQTDIPRLWCLRTRYSMSPTLMWL